MKLLVGLGNPGSRYENNRHNIGYKILQFWVQKQSQQFQEQNTWNGLISKFSFAGENIIALLPTTFMNRSGEAVAKVLQYYQIPVENMIVLHDELDIAACTFRIKRGGGHAGHNGLRSIHPHGDNYIRIRLGIGRPEHPEIEVADYVLGNFSKEEQKMWENIYPNIEDALALCIAGKVEEAMNKFNRKEKV